MLIAHNHNAPIPVPPQSPRVLTMGAGFWNQRHEIKPAQSFASEGHSTSNMQCSQFHVKLKTNYETQRVYTSAFSIVMSAASGSRIGRKITVRETSKQTRKSLITQTKLGNKGFIHLARSTHTPKQAARTLSNKEKNCWIKWPLCNNEKTQLNPCLIELQNVKRMRGRQMMWVRKFTKNLLKQTKRAQEKGFQTPKESSRNRSNHTHQKNSPNQSSTRFSYIHKWDPQIKTRKLARYSTVQDTVTMGRKTRRKGARKGYRRDRGRARASD